MGFLGMLVGKVGVETPDHVVVHKSDAYEVWRFPAQVAATVHANDLPRAANGDVLTDNEMSNKAFPILARYIGVFKDPENTKSSSSGTGTETEEKGEKVAMTAPVIMTGDKDETEEKGEKVAMTAPVIMSGGEGEGEGEGEKVAMTAPVVMSSEGQEEEGENKGQSMTFLLPSKYTSVDQAPVPSNKAVKLSVVEDGRCEAVLRFSGSFNMNEYQKKADELIKLLDEDKVKIVGKWTFHGYNPPFTLPWLRRNEIHIPVDAEPYKDVEGTPKQD